MTFPAFPSGFLDARGLNRHAVFDLASLPATLRLVLGAAASDYRQLILIGHGGKKLWACVRAAGIDGADPIDDYTRRSIATCFAEHLPGCRHRLLYPGSQRIGLQQLGALAGWHQPSPFMLGIDAQWGSWFAYRAVVLADSEFAPSPAVDRNTMADAHPCDHCRDQACIAHCPAEAMTGGTFLLDRCITYRQQADSACRFTCLARIACPLGAEHRYSEEQLRHTYAHSLQMIRRSG